MHVRFQVILFMLLAAMACDQASAVQCRRFLDNEVDLDQALEQSSYAFVARVSLDRVSEPPVLKFTVFEPPLKGIVPKSGSLEYAKTFCSQIDLLLDEGIIVVFLHSLDEVVTRQNATLLSLTEDGPSYRWVSDWLREKTSIDSLE